MQRRELLAAAGLAGLSGCLGYDVVDSETVTDRKVRIAELEAKLDRRDEQLAAKEARIEELETRLDTERERRRAPRINEVGIVSEWEQLGDVVHHRIDEVPPGERAQVAVNFGYRYDPGTDPRGSEPAVGVVLEVVTFEGFQVGRAGRRVELPRDRTRRLHETVLRVDVNGLPTGTYIALVGVTDLVTGLAAPSDSIVLPVQ
jgi:hypothetical protein